MNILIVQNTVIPVSTYGGIERIVWWLGKELNKKGHKITYLVPEGSSCPFAKCIPYDKEKPINDQIPEDIDFVHLHFQTQEKIKKPYLISHHTNYHPHKEYDINTVFSSRNQAERNGSKVYVYNGVDIGEMGEVDFDRKREHLVFMAYAKRPEKNLKDSKYIAKKTGNTLAVIGQRNNFFRQFNYRIKCKGFLGGKERSDVLNSSKGLLFPVLWHEPFGIAVIECMYFGAPAFVTPYGSLPEIVQKDVGFVSNSRSALVEAVKNIGQYDPRRCHEYVCDEFNSKRMTENYLEHYETVLSGGTINPTKPVNGENFDRNHLLKMEI